jgi:hypothetical protein
MTGEHRRQGIYQRACWEIWGRKIAQELAGYSSLPVA